MMTKHAVSRDEERTMEGFTFRKGDRLRKGADFKRVYDKGRRIRGRLMLLVCLETSLGAPRLGVSVSRRFGGAVARNRIKRIFREVFRLNRKALGMSCDVVMIPQSADVAENFGAAEAEFVELAGRLRR